ncbi:MAG: beta-class carbonic anhydrase [Clostridium sp.]|uniref:beta-class carbonic anhydrase n=1 Tax=Clostridium sp. TaxID=1506 RepID=UPI003EE508B0
MSIIENIMTYNKEFVENKDYEEYIATKTPNKKAVILSCMDTRLTELLPKAMNIKNGDVKIIKNAGAVIAHPFGSIIRSILVAVYEFNVKDVIVVGHYGCGMCNLNTEDMIEKMKEREIKEETLEVLNNAGIDVNEWLKGFSSVDESVKNSVSSIKKHPLMPKDVRVHGLIIDPKTGKLDIVIEDNIL